ncbi:MAG: RDD family protein [Candidatus Riflebacteria bacterium]|nr:RDD family protein [Candidatus Riflebacteria bacterium]
MFNKVSFSEFKVLTFRNGYDILQRASIVIFEAESAEADVSLKDTGVSRMKAQSKSQNLSILLTDLQGYSDASSACSREEIVELIRRHNQLMTPVIEFYGGNIVKGIGDALLCTFPSATDAVVCAIIIQLLLKEYNSRQKDALKRMNLRVVINTGDVSIEANDIFGEAVNVTARMETLACFPGGTIGISESTYLLMNRNEIVAEKIGPQTLKGVPEPVTVYNIPVGSQKLTSIPAKLLQLVEKIIEGKTPAAAGTAKFSEWTKEIKGFLKEKNWGENVQKQIGVKVNYIQKQLSKALSQKPQTLSQTGAIAEASVGKRLAAFAIDMFLISILCMILSGTWWISQRMLFGRTTISAEEYKNPKYDSSSYERDYDSGSSALYIRKMGISEMLIHYNVKYPLLLIYCYFFLSWVIKSATPGQFLTKTRLINEDGCEVGLKTSAVRSVMYVFSTFFLLGLGAVTTLFGEKRAVYDKFTNTRVVEVFL